MARVGTHMDIKKLTFAALGALAVSAAPALAEDTATTVPSAQEQCATIKAASGTDAFKAAYGTNKTKSNAFGKCVSARTTATEEAAAEAKTNAAKECDAERTADPVAFETTYGTNKTKSNAYGKCVSTKAKAKTAATVEEQTDAIVAAAKSCKAERQADPTAFKAKYGTNATKSNAFGKCVSAQAKAQQDKPEETTTSS
jgi:hypothetical protein